MYSFTECKQVVWVPAVFNNTKIRILLVRVARNTGKTLGFLVTYRAKRGSAAPMYLRDIGLAFTSKNAYYSLGTGEHVNVLYRALGYKPDAAGRLPDITAPLPHPAAMFAKFLQHRLRVHVLLAAFEEEDKQSGVIVHTLAVSERQRLPNATTPIRSDKHVEVSATLQTNNCVCMSWRSSIAHLARSSVSFNAFFCGCKIEDGKCPKHGQVHTNLPVCIEGLALRAECVHLDADKQTTRRSRDVDLGSKGSFLRMELGLCVAAATHPELLICPAFLGRYDSLSPCVENDDEAYYDSVVLALMEEQCTVARPARRAKIGYEVDDEGENTSSLIHLFQQAPVAAKRKRGWLLPQPGDLFATSDDNLRRVKDIRRSLVRQTGQQRVIGTNKTVEQLLPIRHENLVEDTGGVTLTHISELIDLEGLRVAIELCEECVQIGSKETARKARVYLEYLFALRQERVHDRAANFKLPMSSSGLIPVSVTTLTYATSTKSGFAGGRLYARSTWVSSESDKSDPRSLSIQGCPSRLRPFLCGRFAVDLDIVNCQPTLLSQMVARLRGSDSDIRETLPDLPFLERWISARDAVVAELAEHHRLDAHPTVSNSCDQKLACKELVKKLVATLLFGGSYGSWVTSTTPPRRALHPSVLEFQASLAMVREVVLAQPQHSGFLENVRKVKMAEAKQQAKTSTLTSRQVEEAHAASMRSAFALLMQDLENKVLACMRLACIDQGAVVLSLQFDGIILLNNARTSVDKLVDAMKKRVLRDLHYIIEIIEKPLYDPTLPTALDL
jgi:hypothetical protein